MKTALTIAGSDSSGGAGIQADLKTMIANGVYAMTAITALTAQNTTGVQGIFEVTPEFLEQQIDSVFTDIRPDAVKIGMVSSVGLIESIAKKLKQYEAENIVVDPVMVATSGSRLISEDAIGALKELLLPMATVLTPNIPETEVLSGMEVKTADDMIAAAKYISETYHCAVLCKGGHQLNDANDLLYRNGDYKWFNGKRIDNPNTHGTGCTLSSAMIWTPQWSAQKLISPALWQPCLILDRVPAPWITDLIFVEKDLRRKRHDRYRTSFKRHRIYLGRIPSAPLCTGDCRRNSG